MTSTKRQAYQFLVSIREQLDRQLPGPTEMRRCVNETITDAISDPAKKHLRNPEHVFVNKYLAEPLFQLVSDYPGMTKEKAKKAFLSESHESLSTYCSGSPARRLRHPFNKVLGVNVATIYQRWRRELKKTNPLTQSCPDFAFRSPFPHNIVFEAKYFSRGNRVKAQSELVASSYQAFFYRALPSDRTETSRPDWDYEYACLIAYDASPEGFLIDAWQQLDSEVRDGFWEGANVFVMVLRGVNLTTGSTRPAMPAREPGR